MQKAVTGSAFRNLTVWQKAIVVVESIYAMTRKLPDEERYGLSSQMQRCAVSIPSNIAEGAKRGKKEFIQFLRIANGSAAELETQLVLAERVHRVHVEHIHGQLHEVQKMIESLIRKI